MATQPHYLNSLLAALYLLNLCLCEGDSLTDGLKLCPAGLHPLGDPEEQAECLRVRIQRQGFCGKSQCPGRGGGCESQCLGCFLEQNSTGREVLLSVQRETKSGLRLAAQHSSSWLRHSAENWGIAGRQPAETPHRGAC